MRMIRLYTTRSCGGRPVVRDGASVAAVAAAARAAGTVTAIVHTAGVSPSQAASTDIIDIGGVPARPGDDVDAAEEIRRTIP
jgi:dihydropteroate synthase